MGKKAKKNAAKISKRQLHVSAKNTVDAESVLPIEKPQTVPVKKETPKAETQSVLRKLGAPQLEKPTAPTTPAPAAKPVLRKLGSVVPVVTETPKPTPPKADIVVVKTAEDVKPKVVTTPAPKKEAKVAKPEPIKTETPKANVKTLGIITRTFYSKSNVALAKVMLGSGKYTTVEVDISKFTPGLVIELHKDGERYIAGDIQKTGATVAGIKGLIEKASNSGMTFETFELTDMVSAAAVTSAATNEEAIKAWLNGRTVVGTTSGGRIVLATKVG